MPSGYRYTDILAAEASAHETVGSKSDPDKTVLITRYEIKLPYDCALVYFKTDERVDRDLVLTHLLIDTTERAVTRGADTSRAIISPDQQKSYKAHGIVTGPLLFPLSAGRHSFQYELWVMNEDVTSVVPPNTFTMGTMPYKVTTSPPSVKTARWFPWSQRLLIWMITLAVTFWIVFKFVPMFPELLSHI